MKLKKYILLMLTTVLFSCENSGKLGYQQENNEIIYRTWNEGHGFKTRNVTGDVSGFQNIDGVWAIDKSYVFYKGHKLEYLTSDNFIRMDAKFGKDANYVYCGLSLIDEADARSFDVYTDQLPDSFGKDENAAYFCSGDLGGYVRFESKSIDSFKRLGEYYFSDNQGIRWGNNRWLDLNSDGFRIIGDSYVTDGHRIYYEYYLLENADVDTFEVLDVGKARDKNYYYSFENRSGKRDI